MAAERFFQRTGEGACDMNDRALRTSAMANFVAAHKAQIPGAPVNGFGYSNGANILASVAMAQPDLFDLVGLLHPLIPWAAAAIPALAGKRILISAGKQDPICPWPLSQQLIDWFTSQGAQLSIEVHDGGHELRQPEDILTYVPVASCGMTTVRATYRLSSGEARLMSAGTGAIHSERNASDSQTAQLLQI